MRTLKPLRRIFIRRSPISEKRSTVVSLSSKTFLSFATARISSIPNFHIPSTQKNSSSGSSKQKKQNARKTRRINGRVSNPHTRSTGGNSCPGFMRIGRMKDASSTQSSPHVSLPLSQNSPSQKKNG